MELLRSGKVLMLVGLVFMYSSTVFSGYSTSMRSASMGYQGISSRWHTSGSMSSSRITSSGKISSGSKSMSAINRPGGSAINRPGGSVINRPGGSTINRPGGSTINRPGGSIISMHGGSTINMPAGGTNNRPGDSTISMHGGSSINRPGGSTINRPAGSTINRPGDSTISMHGGSTINRPGDSTINRHGGSTISMHGGSTINMPADSTIDMPANSFSNMMAPAPDTDMPFTYHVEDSNIDRRICSLRDCMPYIKLEQTIELSLEQKLQVLRKKRFLRRWRKEGKLRDAPYRIRYTPIVTLNAEQKSVILSLYRNYFSNREDLPPISPAGAREKRGSVNICPRQEMWDAFVLGMTNDDKLVQVVQFADTGDKQWLLDERCTQDECSFVSNCGCIAHHRLVRAIVISFDQSVVAEKYVKVYCCVAKLLN